MNQYIYPTRRITRRPDPVIRWIASALLLAASASAVAFVVAWVAINLHGICH